MRVNINDTSYIEEKTKIFDNIGHTRAVKHISFSNNEKHFRHQWWLHEPFLDHFSSWLRGHFHSRFTFFFRTRHYLLTSIIGLPFARSEITLIARRKRSSECDENIQEHGKGTAEVRQMCFSERKEICARPRQEPRNIRYDTKATPEIEQLSCVRKFCHWRNATLKKHLFSFCKCSWLHHHTYHLETIPYDDK